MTKLFAFVFLFIIIFGLQKLSATEDDALIKKAKSFIDPKLFSKDKTYLETLFFPKTDFYDLNDKVDSVKVIQTLKNSGIINLFFKKPSEMTVTFKTDGATMLFVKIMSDSLRNIGYYKYITKESSIKDKEFMWKISLVAEYATDPVVLSSELDKSGCKIVDIVRESPTDWTYVIDMKNAKLDVKKLSNAEEVSLKRSLYAYWLDVSKIKNLEIISSDRNNWYPYIAYYDKSLMLLRVVKQDEKKRKMHFEIEDGVHYIKISDIYTLKNIKDPLVLNPSGNR